MYIEIKTINQLSTIYVYKTIYKIMHLNRCKFKYYITKYHIKGSHFESSAAHFRRSMVILATYTSTCTRGRFFGKFIGYKNRIDQYNSMCPATDVHVG